MRVDNIAKIIDSIAALSSSGDMTHEEVTDLFFQLEKLPLFQYELPAGTPVFRTRTHIDDSFFTAYKDISITPAQYISGYGRCNLPQQSVFYCSDHRVTSYMELATYWSGTKKPGDHLYVSVGRWELQEPLRLFLIVNPNPAQRTKAMNDGHGARFDEIVKGYPKNVQQAIGVLYSFLDAWFICPAEHNPHTYIITSAFYNLAMKVAGGKIDGLLYPSVPFGGQGVNLAISESSFLQKKLKLTQVNRSQLIIRENPYKKYSFTEAARTEASEIDEVGGVIHW